ncbi:MAG: signal peptidase I [Sedimentisphaerales bacterium]|nr:signal peptidase I [Sedimentisphaerales bacterium]
MAEQKKSKTTKHKDVVTEVAGIFEELAGALIMALMIIGFVVQPFIIPTGSMAETLRGMHFRQRCSQCGYRYERNFETREYGLSNTQSPWGDKIPPVSRCPSCGYYNDNSWPVDVARGDKILALKCLYNFFEPKRWDVVVFKNPTQPSQNYIKRLIGKPGETVEIIDGDIYIDNQIARKPPKVQNELWMVVYDSRYEPVNPAKPAFNGHEWEIPFQNYGNSRWHISKNGRVSFELDRVSSIQHRLAYDTSRGNNFGINYAYNPVEDYGGMPKCSDIKVCFNVEMNNQDADSLIGACLRKYQRCYKAWITSSNQAYIAEMEMGREKILTEGQFEIPKSNRPLKIKFSNVDHLLTFEFGDEKLQYDLGLLPEDAGRKVPEAEPEVEIIGAGKLRVWNVEIYRDIYYTSQSPYQHSFKGAAVEGNPLTLKDDEFFVMGDNSPQSLDGRWWDRAGIGNNGQMYRRGIVPRDYLTGKAFVVFWPSGYKPFERFPLRLVPDVRQFRLIYSGSDKEQ